MTDTAIDRGRAVIPAEDETNLSRTSTAKARLLRIPGALLGPKLLNELRILLHLAEPTTEEPSPSTPLLTSDR